LSNRNNGMLLVELMIVVILISVISTAFWNFNSDRSEPAPQQIDNSRDSSIQAALDEIGYHICFARRNPADSHAKSIVIDDGFKSDRILIYHDNSTYEYFVDDEDRLIRRHANEDIVLGARIYSLNISRIGSQTLVVTISTGLYDEQHAGPGGLVSRSFSTVVASNGIS